jgi:predicted adenylyl cyclase CyaB
MRNLEAKFPLANRAVARQRAEAIGFKVIGTLIQHDTFFSVPNGKLKLREQSDGAWLIHYSRTDADELQLSRYQIVAVSEVTKLREVLASALRVLAEVQKTRTLLRRANVRLHLDEVEGRGVFGEIELVLNDGENPADHRIEVREILAALQISPDELIDQSYFELMR